jgi:uncharacterized phage protein (TIGR02218 family)
MSFLPNEIAANQFASEPIELFTVARGNEAWYFTSHDVDVVRDGITYRASLAGRERFKQSEESTQSTTTLNIARRHPLGAELLLRGLNNANGTLYLRIALTTEGDEEYWPAWIGEVTDLIRHDSHAQVEVASMQNLMRRPMLRVVGGTQCNHALYDTGCGVNMEDYRLDTDISLVAGRQITVTDTITDSVQIMLRGGSYAGGVLVVGKQRWFIERNVSSSLILMTPMPDDMLGETVAIYKGCSRTYDICQSRFDNTRNFGGFAKWPVTSPFSDAE